MKLTQSADVINRNHVLRLTMLGVAATAAGALIAWVLMNHNQAQLGFVPAQLRHRPSAQPTEVNQIETGLLDDRSEAPPKPRPARRWLDSFGWTDKKRERIHIPIDRAIDLYLERDHLRRRERTR